MGNTNAKYQVSTANHFYCKGFLYSKGIFVPQDDRDAFKCYKKAAEQDNSDAQCALGKCYHTGIGVIQNSKLAFEWYTKAADQKHKDAEYGLGVCYEKGQGVEQDEKEAVEWYTKAAKKGNAQAQFMLGNHYFNGLLVVRNYEKATKWLTKSAKLGNSQAQTLLGTCYEKGHGVNQDNNQAFEWYAKAARQGHADGQILLAHCYKNGHNVKQNYEQAFKWYSRAAQQSHADAEFNLGNCYYNSIHVGQDFKQAVKWYSKSSQQGHAGAQFKLFNCYFNGEGVDQDKKIAFEWLRKVAEKGHAGAQFNLGNCYEQGEQVEADFKEAVKWYKAASEQGEYNALFRLGTMYHNGRVGIKDTTKAAELIFKVVEESSEETLKEKAFHYLLENLNDSSTAMFYIGKCYHNGLGTEKNSVEAMTWYKRADKQGYSEAMREIGILYFEKVDEEEAAKFWFQGAKAPRNIQLNRQCFSLLVEKLSGNTSSHFYIGECYCKGYGVYVNAEKGVTLYRKAANLGYADAQNALGQCYINAKGVKSDVKEALRLWKLAADQDHAGALFNLGVYFFHGLGGARNVEQAFEYYSKAAYMGHLSAQCSLGELYSNGEGVGRDYKKAFDWFLKAAERNNAEAQFNVGVCYHFRYGVKVDHYEAANWYRKAASLGHSKAQNNLGDCYENGRGVEQSYDRALEWYNRAAQQGELIAFVGLGDCHFALKEFTKAADNYLIASQKNLEVDPCRLGDCYYLRQGEVQDYSMAVKLYREAAEKGNAEAMYKLSTCYKFGHGVNPDPDEASKWLNSSANHGCAEAQFDLGKTCELNGEEQEALEWRIRAADRDHANSQTKVNEGENTESKTDNIEGVGKHRAKSQNNKIQTELISKEALNDAVEVNNAGFESDYHYKSVKIQHVASHIVSKVFFLNDYIADSRAIHTGSTHNSLILPVSSISEGDKSFVVKVFPPVKEEEWIEFSNMEMKRGDSELSLSEPMKRFRTEISILRELEKYDYASHGYHVPMKSFGNIPYDTIIRIEPDWTLTGLERANLSQEDRVVFPAIVMEKRSPYFFMEVRKYIDSISFLPGDIRATGVFLIVGRLLSCLAYLHENNKVWCDCNPSNFVRKPGIDEFADTIAMIDLDGCVMEGNPVSEGTPLFIPPEYYEHESSLNPLKAEASYDMWSFGVTLLVFFSDTAAKSLYLSEDTTTPHNELPDKVLATLQNAGVKYDLDHLDKHLYFYIRGLLNKDPYERPSAASLNEIINRIRPLNISSKELLDKIYSEVVKLRGTVGESSMAINYISQSIDLLHQDESKQLPRHFFATWVGSCILHDRYKFQLLCDGAWAFEEINAEGKNDIACDCHEFKVKIPKNTYNEFLPVLSKVMITAETCLSVHSRISPNQVISKSLTILGSAAHAASEMYESVDQTAPSRNLGNSEDDEKKEEEDELVHDSFLKVFKFLSDRGLWDGSANTGPFERMVYYPRQKNDVRCDVFMCKEHMKEARKHESFFEPYDEIGRKGVYRSEPQWLLEDD